MTKLNSSFMIGNVEIPHRTVLAPMAGVTNSAFRTIAKEFGAGLVVMEMISEKGLLYNNEKTLHMLHIDENNRGRRLCRGAGNVPGRPHLRLPADAGKVPHRPAAGKASYAAGGLRIRPPGSGAHAAGGASRSANGDQLTAQLPHRHPLRGCRCFFAGPSSNSARTLWSK